MNLENILAALANIKAHPKTTLLGAALAILLHFTGAVNWHAALLQIGVFALAALAKDPLSK